MQMQNAFMQKKCVIVLQTTNKQFFHFVRCYNRWFSSPLFCARFFLLVFTQTPVESLFICICKASMAHGCLPKWSRDRENKITTQQWVCVHGTNRLTTTTTTEQKKGKRRARRNQYRLAYSSRWHTQDRTPIAPFSCMLCWAPGEAERLCPLPLDAMRWEARIVLTFHHRNKV